MNLKKLLMSLSIIMIISASQLITGYATGNLVNVALNKEVSITAGVVDGGSKEALVDGTGNYSSIGSGNGVGFIVDLGVEYSLKEFKIYAMSGNSAGRNQVWLDVSADGVEWQNIVARNNDVSDAFSAEVQESDVLTVLAPENLVARYVRITGGTYTCWTELEVYVQEDVEEEEPTPVIPPDTETYTLVNVSTNKDVSVTTGTLEGDKQVLVDGAADTGYTGVLWDNVNKGVGFIVDLGKEYDLKEFKIYAISGNPSGRDQLSIDASLDGVVWNNVHTRSSGVNDEFSSSQKLSDVLSVKASCTARYIRLTSETYGLWCEFEAYAAVPEAKRASMVGREITIDFSTPIAETANLNTIELYVGNTKITDFTPSVNGKKIILTLNKDWFDTKFIVKVSKEIQAVNGDKLSADAEFSVNSSPAVEIENFSSVIITNAAKVTANIKNNTSDMSADAVVFALLLDENNAVIDRAIEYITVEAGQEIPSEISINTTTAPQNCKVKAFIWQDLKDMQVRAESMMIEVQ